MRVAIIGGGIAGLAAAYELSRLARDGVSVEAVLYESSNRFGGLIETVREGGFTVEAGPDAWVTAKPWARELAVELGLDDELLPSNDSTRKTWIYLNNRLAAMPEGMNLMVPTRLDALAGGDADSSLFTAAAVAAYRAEPGRAAELRAAAPMHDESVAEFTLRHFGPEVLDRVAAPLLSGVFGGDVRRLSVRAVMPAFVQMEREHGSLIAALRAAAAHRHAPGEAIFTTLRSGLGTLVDRLVAAIPTSWLRLNTAVTALEPPRAGERGWSVSARGGGLLACDCFDAVFLATPLDATRRLLARLDPKAAELLPCKSSSAVLIAFCFPDAARVPVPPGFGFLVPQRLGDSDVSPETTKPILLACTFADQKFAERVPANGRLLRAFFGGESANRLARCNNDEIAAIARLELARILNSHADARGSEPAPLPAPMLTVVRRWPNSLPQYAVGHLDRVAEVESRLRELPGLTLLGNALHGVGLPDLIRDARAAARNAATNR